MELIDRRAECDLLDEVLHDARSGESRVLVLHGDPGVGKSALMEYVVTHAAGCRLLRSAGVESEMELAHAALAAITNDMAVSPIVATVTIEHQLSFRPIRHLHASTPVRRGEPAWTPGRGDG